MLGGSAIKVGRVPTTKNTKKKKVKKRKRKKEVKENCLAIIIHCILSL